MTDAELQAFWPDLGLVVAELRCSAQTAVADLLFDAVGGGATSGEILGEVGVVLRRRHALRAGLSPAAAKAWDAVLADVDRAYPGARLRHWLARLLGRGG